MGGIVTSKTKIWKWLLTASIFIICFSSRSYAAGWDCQWRYLQKNGQPVQGWQQLEWQGDLDWYYFDPYGFMQRGWQLIGEKWYYFYESGQMADGEAEIGGRKVQFEQGVLIDPPNDEAHRKASYARDERTEAEILQAEEKIRQAVEYCNQGETPYEKAYRICEWMKEHLYYDLNGPYDVVGALNAGGTICEGYAVVYREIADRMGFYCEKIVSRKMNHAWNFIVVDGMEYYTDVTWEDGGNQLFNMLLGEEIERTHTIEAVQHQSQF